MNDLIYLCIILVILIVLVLIYNNHINLNIKNLEFKIQDEKENFKCLNKPFRKKQSINYPKIKKIYKEDEDINYEINIPLKSKPKKYFDNIGWRNFYKNKFNNSLLIHQDNFKGTRFRNYLDNLVFLRIKKK